jgi:PHD/YefM family antitoxin component YafN of YafNO toxin-antitoxin module
MEDKAKPVTDDVHSRVDTSVPQPEAVNRLNEDEKRALELQGEVEHAQGARREEIIERAADATGASNV